MKSVSRREVLSVVAAGAISLTFGQTAAAADEEKTITPEAVVKHNITGTAIVEFIVGGQKDGTGFNLGSSIAFGGISGVVLRPKDDAKRKARFSVWLQGNPTHTLLRLGIKPWELYPGKIIRVKGTIRRSVESDGVTAYELPVTSLDQIEEVRDANQPRGLQ